MSRRRNAQSLAVVALMALVALLSTLPFAPTVAHAAPASPGHAPTTPRGVPSSPLPPLHRTWTVVPSGSPGNYYNILSGVSGVAANDVWAVGCVDTCQHPLTEHWNGSRWSIVPSPDAPNSYSNTLSGVAAVATNDVWAVGSYDDDTYGMTHTLIEHWDGVRWSVVPSPNPGGSGNVLYAVTAISATDVWAVGYLTAYPSGTEETLTERWDGTSWRFVSSPDRIGGITNHFYGVSGTSSSDMWAVGSYSTPSQSDQTLVEHWDGTYWTVIPSPNVPDTGFTQLSAVSAISASNVWAVGYYRGPAPEEYYTLAEHWDGAAWSIVSTPIVSEAGAVLAGLTALNANDMWAVGASSVAGAAVSQTLIEHWDGATWSEVPSPSVGISNNYLLAITIVQPATLWAVGQAYSGGYQTLTESAVLGMA